MYGVPCCAPKWCVVSYDVVVRPSVTPSRGRNRTACHITAQDHLTQPAHRDVKTETGTRRFRVLSLTRTTTPELRTHMARTICLVGVKTARSMQNSRRAPCALSIIKQFELTATMLGIVDGNTQITNREHCACKSLRNDGGVNATHVVQYSELRTAAV